MILSFDYASEWFVALCRVDLEQQIHSLDLTHSFPYLFAWISKLSTF